MARARNIKPGFFLNEELVELPFEYRLLFIGLWTLADREGRLEDRPKRIKMQVFPADDVDIDAGLDGLQSRGFLLRYALEDQRFIEIANWNKHQQPHVKERDSEIPPPDKHIACTGQAPDKHGAKTPDSLIPDSLIPDSLIPDSQEEESSLRSDSCAEQPQAAAPSPASSDEPPVITLPMNKSEYPVTQSQVAEWIELYPAVDIHQELRNMRGWLNANPKKRKTRTGTPRFINAWLSREQDKGPSQHSPRASPHQSKQQSLEARNQSAVDEWLNNSGTIIEGETDNVRH